MLETYKQFRRSTTVDYVKKSNEELVQIYKNAKVEYERSQSIGALFIKNFPALLRVTSKYDYLDSSEKAGMITMELVNTLNDYDASSSKFITYLINRAENLFLWNYTNNKNKINFFRNMESLEQHEGVEEDGHFSCTVNEHYKQIEDPYEKDRQIGVELKISMEYAFDNELSKYSEGTAEYKKAKERIEFDKSVLSILSDDPSQSSDQIARKLGLFSKKEEYFESKKYPDYAVENVLDDNGNPIYDKFGRPLLKEIVITRVRKSQYFKVQEAIRDIRRIFKDNKIYTM